MSQPWILESVLKAVESLPGHESFRALDLSCGEGELIDEIRAMFRGDKVNITPDATQYLQDIACTVGLGMLGLAASIFEKSYRAALRSKKLIDADLLRTAARRVLIPAGNIEHETILQIEHTGERNRKMAVNRCAE